MTLVNRLRELGKTLQDDPSSQAIGEDVMNAADLLIAADKLLGDMEKGYAGVLLRHGYSGSVDSLDAAREFRTALNAETGYCRVPRHSFPDGWLKVGVTGNLKFTTDSAVRREWRERGCGTVYAAFLDR